MDEARAHFTRVQLLFGSTTPAGRAALSLLSQLSHVVEVLDDLEVDHAETAFCGDVGAADENFTRDAHRALLRPSLRDPEGVLSLEEALDLELVRENEAEREHHGANARKRIRPRRLRRLWRSGPHRN